MSLALLLVGCQQASPEASIVVARVADDGGTAAVSLRGETRDAFRAMRPAPRRFELAAPAQELVFSVGIRPTIPAGAEARFVVRGRTGEQWAEIFSETRGVAGRWFDHVVPLADLKPAPEEFEFYAEWKGSGEAQRGAPYFGSVAFTGKRPGPELPNVVLVSLDTLGADYLGSTGELAGVSPEMDRLLERSFSFERAYAPFGATLQSHRSLFTGRHSDSLGARWEHSSLIRRFAAAGYLTAAQTENGLVAAGLGFADGFDRYSHGPNSQKLRRLAGFADETFEFAARFAERFDDIAPFLLFVHTYQVHNPYRPRSAEAQAIADRITPGDQRGYFAAARRSKMNKGDPRPAEDLARLRALYIGGIRDLDQAMGSFLARLEELTSADRTLLVVFSDHGEEFRPEHVGHGGLHNRVLRVPLGFFWPGRVSPGKSDAVVELTDALPTVLDLIGLPVPPNLDGTSLSALMAGDDAETDGAFAFDHYRPPGCKSKGCIEFGYAFQDDRFKLTRSPRPGDAGLYDLSADPGETRDVSAEFPEEEARLARELDRRIARLRTPDAGREASPDEEPLELEPATTNRLRTLGYIE